MTKRAQGLPLNTIVLALIALLVLVLIIAYFSGFFGTIIGQTKTLQETVQAEVTSAQTKCAQYCIAAQTANFEDESDWKDSDFCQETFEIENQTVYCYNAPISQSCTVKIDNVEYSDC